MVLQRGKAANWWYKQWLCVAGLAVKNCLTGLALAQDPVAADMRLTRKRRRDPLMEETLVVEGGPGGAERYREARSQTWTARPLGAPAFEEQYPQVLPRSAARVRGEHGRRSGNRRFGDRGLGDSVGHDIGAALSVGDLGCRLDASTGAEQ